MEGKDQKDQMKTIEKKIIKINKENRELRRECEELKGRIRLICEIEKGKFEAVRRGEKSVVKLVDGKNGGGKRRSREVEFEKAFTYSEEKNSVKKTFKSLLDLIPDGDDGN